MIKAIFAWIGVQLGIAHLATIAEFYHRQLEEKLIELQDQLNAIQKDKLKFYVDKPKPRAAAMDYEASQRATLEEFKEN